MNGRSGARAILFGVAAGVIVAIAYAVFAEVLELTLGLLVIGFAGGWLIGNGVAYGAWSGREHERSSVLVWSAVAISVVAWVGAVFLAFVISQALIPQASTSVASRVTLGGFLDYFNGLDLTRLVHLVALALIAVMAWRGAR